MADASLPADATVATKTNIHSGNVFLLGMYLKSAMTEQEWSASLQQVQDLEAKDKANH